MSTSGSENEITAAVKRVKKTLVKRVKKPLIKKQTPVKIDKKPAPVQNDKKQSPLKNVKKQAPVKDVKKLAPVKNEKKQAPEKNVKKQAVLKDVKKQSLVKDVKKQALVKDVKKQAPVKCVKKKSSDPSKRNSLKSQEPEMLSSESDCETSHSVSLKRLKSRDPDFYEFLKENDTELLDFEDIPDGEESDEEINDQEVGNKDIPEEEDTGLVDKLLNMSSDDDEMEDQDVKSDEDIRDQEMESDEEIEDQDVESDEEIEEVESDEQIEDQEVESGEEIEDQEVESGEEIEDQEVESDEEIEENGDISEKHVKNSVSKLSREKLEVIKSQISKNPTAKLCKDLMYLFKTCVQQADGYTKNKVEMGDVSIFNGVMKLCLVELVPALKKVLKVNASSQVFDPTQAFSWKLLRISINTYLINILKMIKIMSQSGMLSMILKHIVHLVPFYAHFRSLARKLVKQMIEVWSTKEDTVRVLSFLIIMRAIKIIDQDFVGIFLKKMYFSYVRNTKFTSKVTWPVISFMKKSLIELYGLYPDIAYEHAFVFIRQMAIHLRTAISKRTPETHQVVYSWQFIHASLFWANFLGSLHEHNTIVSLLYPFVQNVLGTINLVPSPKYVPLRFHLIRALIEISSKTGVFISVLPLILDVLEFYDTEKKPRFSMKALDFSCALKVSKSQLMEAGFKDACIAGICELLQEYLAIYASSIGFVELAFPVVLRVKSFIKKCRVSKHKEQLKAILVKIDANGILIRDKRRSVKFSEEDAYRIQKWENKIKEETKFS